MSNISNEISRIENAKQTITTSITSKGITVPSSAKISDLSEYIDSIVELRGEEQALELGGGTYTVTPSEGKNGITKLELTVNATNVDAIVGIAVVGKSVVGRTSVSPSGIPGGYNVTFVVDDEVYAFYSVVQGQAITEPTAPTIEGKPFIGWSTTNSSDDIISFPYTPTADTTLYAISLATFVLGFTGLTNSSGALTLTDDIASFDTYSTNTVGKYVSVTNPLDNVFPYNAIEEFTDSEGNVFVKYPKIWVKWITNSSGDIDGWKISNNQVDDSYFVPDAYLNPSTSEYNDYFALGKYEMSGSSSKGYSKSNQACLVKITRTGARGAARAYGDSSNQYNGYQIEDISMFVVYNFLCMMYYHTANIQTVYGGRTGAGSVSSWSGASTTGTCDSVVGFNGWNTATDCVKMLGIENPYGNVWKWIDGIYFSGSAVYYQRYPQNFAGSTANSSNIGFSRPTSDGYISALRPGATTATQSCVYCSAINGSSTTYVGDRCGYYSSVVELSVGGYWGNGSYAGLWYLGDGAASSPSSYIGARLAKRDI